MAMHHTARVHTVAIGASAGGIEALRDLVAALPGDFPAALLVVLHLPPDANSVLPQILSRAGSLRAVQAEDGAALGGGTIAVAPPDAHLLVEDGRVRLEHGPRINGHRPAIDPLFRSVADAYGAAAAGVVLSGVLDDGTAGLMAIKRAGGVTFAQDPDDALYEMMPRNAIELVTPDHVAPARELGALLARLAAPPPDEPAAADPPRRQELRIEVGRGASDRPQPGEPTGLTCPACNGAIWLSEEDRVPTFVCRTGHAYGPATFASAQSDRVEVALWTALRTLEERAVLYRRMADRHRTAGNTRTADRFAVRSDSAVQHASVLREVIDQSRDEGAA
jgi:two-component system, chemotaxis family, protein-glutamate methylesterase/glutaminase